MAWTQEQTVASAHWSMYACTGFPIRKLGRKWAIVVDSTSLWRAITAGGPMLFKTKTAAIDHFNNLCMVRFKEWGPKYSA